MKFSNPLRIIRNLLLFFFVSTTVMVVVYRFVPVYVTPLMVIRSVQQVFKGESPAWHHEWVPFDRISPHLPMAVIASEDNRFATHNGFDFIEIQKAMKGIFLSILLFLSSASGNAEQAPSASRRQRTCSCGRNPHGSARDSKSTSHG